MPFCDVLNTYFFDSISAATYSTSSKVTEVVSVFDIFWISLPWSLKKSSQSAGVVLGLLRKSETKASSTAVNSFRLIGQSLASSVFSFLIVSFEI